MKAKALSLSSFRGVTGDTIMSPLVYLTGPFGSGKSSRLLALRYLALGTTPTGATLEDALRYFGPLGGHVDLLLEDGTRLRRGVEKNARTLEIAGVVQVSTMPGAKIREADEEIRRVLGVFPEQLDVRAFLGLSADKRRAFVLELCGAASSGSLDVLSAIRAEIPDDASVDHVAEILDDLRPHACGISPADSIARVIERAAALTRESQGAAEMERLAAQKLAELKAELRPVVGTEAESRDSLARLRAERDAVLSQLNRQRGREDARRSAMMGLEAARRASFAAGMSLNAARQAVAALPDPAAATTESAAAIHPGPEPSGDEVLRAEAAERDAAQRWSAASADASAALHALHAARRAVDALVEERRRAESNPWTEAKRLFDLAMSLVPDEDRVPFAPLGDHISRCIGSRTTQAIADDLAAAEERLAAADQAHDRAAAALNTAAESKSSSARNVAAVRDAAHRLRAEWMARRDQWESARAAAERSELDRKRALDDLRRAEIAEAAAKRMESDAESAVAAITADAEQVGADTLESQIAGLDALIEKGVADLDARMRRATLEEELSLCIGRANDRTIYHETAKIVDAAARMVRETMMESLVAPMLHHISAFLGRCPGLGAAPYCSLATDRDKPVLHLGWVRDRVRVAVEQMSGAEFCLYVAAIQYAMIQIRRPPLRLLVVDGSEMDRDAMSMLCAAFSASAEGLDHVLVATHIAPPDDLPESWSVVECRREPAEESSLVF